MNKKRMGFKVIAVILMAVLISVLAFLSQTAFFKLGSSKQEKYLVGSTVIQNAGSVAVQLADPKADASTVALYQYLKAVGKSDMILYGHMEDTVLKAGASELTESDTKDMVGSISAVVGFDSGDMFKGYASKYNKRNPDAAVPETTAGNITAAALFSNEAIKEGAVITLSSHMPNFSASKKLEGTIDKTYDQFEYSSADSYVLTGDCMNQILPGGLFNESFRGHLDLIAEYASQVKGTILFRPFHENTGSWFWWGKAFCDAETYKSVYKYTVEYLRDEKNVHNILYLYGPGSEAANDEEYEERYPGDEFVDIIGFDTYDSDPVTDEEGYIFQQNLEKLVNLTDGFAKKHRKLMAVTEIGMSTSAGGGIKETGNKRPEWFTEIMNILTKPEYDCCYFMLWTNYSRSSSFYSPYVEEINKDGTLQGHELLEPFISFYQNKKSIFAADQSKTMKTITAGKKKMPKAEPYSEISGYITTPVARQRILEETILMARVNQKVSKSEFQISGNEKEITIPADLEGKQVTAVLDETTLEKIGEVADGRIALYADGKKLQEIIVMYNVEPRLNDPYLVDDFENYAGLESFLITSWAVNKDIGCELNLTLSDKFVHGGDLALKFEYKETKNGWAGAEISRESDWSGCNTLQFWVKPDGLNQKTVIQIKTKDGGAYEAYLQEYPEYSSSIDPVLVTLPFNEFVDKNGKGRLTSEKAGGISGMGLWINAIPDSKAIDKNGIVSGILYYDDIKAVHTSDQRPAFERKR
ncbi:glycosyl hydrolase [Lacrimispora sp.]|uniref:glycosyl hydrolase n=1 Tax=Lacrimispora sp. TaxID=2719234 RepID=UPI0029E27BCE|nr:mannan endo,4-beta-mannosidase [Lacrimispora sp.]